MADSSTPSSRKDPWTNRAIQYAEEYGWQIVPLQANSKSSPQYSEDEVERQLNSFIPVEYPENATADPQEIKDYGVKFPVALIGAVTGLESGLVAVEITHRDIDPDLRDRIDDLSEGAPRVLGTHREYALFQYPEDEQPLPPITKSDGAVLHGDGSVIRLPWRYYRWSLDSRETLSPPSEDLIALFTSPQTEEEPDSDTDPAATLDDFEQQNRDGETKNTDEEASQDGPLAQQNTQGDSNSSESDGPFRTGIDLQTARHGESNEIQLPWAVTGGVTVLTGHPKTAGKSTWILNLAAHVASGTPFLNLPTDQCGVVLLTDSQPAVFRRTLRRIEAIDEDALSNLHVIHPTDVENADWHETLSLSFRHAADVNARVIIIDSLDVYIHLKQGGNPATSQDVVQAVTNDAPKASTVFAVKSTQTTASQPLSETIGKLDLLGVAADVIVRLDDISTPEHPTLRRIRSVGRSGDTVSPVYCALRNEGYERVPSDEVNSKT